MERLISQGDVVISTAGHDEKEYFLVIDCDGKIARIVNGKTREITNPKIKNVKHLKMVKKAGLKSLAEKINKGETVGNKRLYREIKAQI